jgi:Concanavalin A-like lectin/glucanases superfamily
MSITLLFLMPIGMLAVAWSACFVGCFLNTTGSDYGVEPIYSNLILDESSLLAYWPLNDPMVSPTPLQGSLQGSTSIGTAADLSGKGHTGTYVLPPTYPTNPPAGSAPILGVPLVNMQQGSIVPGDQGGGDANTNPASADFEGGYVGIPWSTQNPPKLNQFTLEAWIQPHWTGTGFDRVVFSAFINNTGFRVLINDQNQLAVVIGNGSAGMESAQTSAIDLATMTYIAATCDMSGTVTLLATGAGDTATPPQMFSNTGYVPADPTQQVTYFIGAGDNEDAPRTQNGVTGAPEFPFQGQIQSVALYATALSTTDLQSHFSAGAPVTVTGGLG